MPPFAVEAQRAPSHRTEKSLLATVAAIAVGTVLIVWFSMQIATVEILEHEATTRARNWAHCISNDVEDIKRFLAGDSTTPHDFQVLNTAENVGDVFSYRILGPDGTVNLASNPGSVGTTVNTAFFPDIVSPGGKPIPGSGTATEPRTSPQSMAKLSCRLYWTAILSVR
jgi:hypothetical protein